MCIICVLHPELQSFLSCFIFLVYQKIKIVFFVVIYIRLIYEDALNNLTIYEAGV